MISSTVFPRNSGGLRKYEESIACSSLNTKDFIDLYIHFGLFSNPLSHQRFKFSFFWKIWFGSQNVINYSDFSRSNRRLPLKESFDLLVHYRLGSKTRPARSILPQRQICIKGCATAGTLVWDLQFGSNQWIQGITYVCTERIFASPQIMYKIFLNKLLLKMLA